MIRETDSSYEEMQNLLGLAKRNIDEALKRSHEADWKFNILYASIINMSDAVLRASGYRAGPTSSHYYLIQSLELTIGADPETVDILETFRKKRNMATYEMAGIVTDEDIREIAFVAETLLRKATAWIRGKYPNKY
jgi:hypothetical protein